MDNSDFESWWQSKGIETCLLENLGHDRSAAKRLARETWRQCCKMHEAPCLPLDAPESRPSHIDPTIEQSHAEGPAGRQYGPKNSPVTTSRAGKGGLRENAELLVPLSEHEI